MVQQGQLVGQGLQDNLVLEDLVVQQDREDPRVLRVLQADLGLKDQGEQQDLEAQMGGLAYQGLQVDQVKYNSIFTKVRYE